MSRWPGRVQPNLSRRPRRWGALLAAGAITLLAGVPAVPARAATAPPRTAATSGSGLLTDAQALAKAHATGKPVPVTGATTDVSALTANPNGTFTLTQESAPVRKKIAGRWAALDATLRRNSDGSLSPAVSTSLLRLSGGGPGPLAVMTDDGASLSLALPGRMPAPVLSGASATYPNVWPGVDLQLTADDQGGFSEALVVKNAAAAANPALRQLTFRTAVTGGISLHADAAGNLAATTRGGHAIFTAPAPTMWDSAAPAKLPPVAVNPATRERVDARDGLPLASGVTGPGTGARASRVGVRAAHGALTLVPDPSVLAGKNTVYPVYIDPSYAAGSTEQAWAEVNNGFPAQAYWKQSGLLQVGDNNWNSPYFVARSFVQESVPSTLYSATIYSSTVYFTDEWSPSCSATEADLYSTGAINSSTTWNNQPSWNTKEAAKSYAYGYSGCPAASVGYDITSLTKSAASGKWANMTLGLRAANESDGYGWKQFSHTVTMSTTYDHAPNTPTNLTTSPASSCSAATPTTVGNGDVILYARVSDPDGGSLSATFSSWNTASSATLDNATVSATSGTTAALRIRQATIDAAAGGAITEFSWNVKVSDGSLSGGTSTTCHFKLDPTSPGPPSINACEGATGTIGTQISFNITPNSSGVIPSSYNVQLNGAAPQTAAADASGNATAKVIPTRGTDALTVTAISAGGNVGESATCIFNATSPTPAADGDLTGDGIPDLVTTGGTSGIPPGLWLAKAEAGSGLTAGDGQIITSGIDIGVEGDGVGPAYSPADFNGAQAVTGLFTDSGLQDTLAYYPSGTYAGQGVVMTGTGDGSVLENEDASNTAAIFPASFTSSDPNQDIPQQVADGYNADPSDNPSYPDLITRSGDATNGYYLEYYKNNGETGTYATSIPCLSTTAPDNTMNWESWQIATTALPSGKVDMFLYDATTSALWLWQDFTVDDTTGTAAHDPQVEISANWNPGTITTMRAADINGDGSPDLWTVSPSGTVTSWLVTGLSGTPTISATASQTLLGPTHAWRLGDGTSGAATTAADTGGSPLALTGNSGTTWDTSDLFNPAVAFDGATGYMSTSSQAVNTASSYTVSAWVKPATLGGVILSQTGTSTSCMDINITTTTTNGVTAGQWNFRMSAADSATAPGWTAATAGDTYNVQPGTWTHLTVTYNKSANYMTMYVNGVHAATTQPSATWSSGCNAFTLGRYIDGGQIHGYFNGKIADVQAWNGTALTPTQAATLSGTPGYVLFPSDSHQYGSAASPSTWLWVTAHGEMNFYQGLVTIKETGAGTATTTYGKSGYPGAVLTLQADGNLVIYQNAADASAGNTGAIWASVTQGNSGDVMFFQPDGNLVIYTAYGKILWASGTQN